MYIYIHMDDILPLYLPPVPGTFAFVQGLETARKHEYHVGRTGRMGPEGKIEFALHRDTIFDRKRFENKEDEERETIDIYIQTKYLTRLAYPEMNDKQLTQRTSLDCPFTLKGLKETFKCAFKYNEDVMRVLFEYLIVKPVQHEEIQISAVSSTSDKDRPVEGLLSPSESSYWLSGNGTMPNGIGKEWVEFMFGGIRRVSFVAVRIPALPHGPCSVRNFYLEWIDINDGTVRRSPQQNKTKLDTFETLNMGTLQVFRIPRPFDADRVRFVCTRNVQSYSMSHIPGGHGRRVETDCVGMFQISFA